MIKTCTKHRTFQALICTAACCFFFAMIAGCKPPLSPVRRTADPGEMVHFVPCQEKLLALTFDDGPNGSCTLQILDTLKQYEVHATFFLVGTNVEHYPDIARRIAAEGHEIGNHSYSHPRFDQLSSSEISEEIAAGERVIAAVTGVTPRWFRQPYGISGTGVVEACRAQGLAIAGWSSHASDWNPYTAREIADHIVEQTTSGDIILLHDGMGTRHGANRRSTEDAVPLILERLIRDGYRFVTMSELLQHAGPPLAEFANGVRLLGIHIPVDPVRPGDHVYVKYIWDLPTGLATESLRAFVHLQLDSSFRFQDDHDICHPETVWDLTLERVILVPPSAPPGRYQCYIGLFNLMHPEVENRVPVRSNYLYRKGTVTAPVTLNVTVNQEL